MRIGTRAFAGLFAAGLSACGGGGGGSESSSPPPEPTLSQDQKTFESVNLQGGQFGLVWRFPFGGGNLVSGTDYLSAVSNGLLPQSPSQGPQIQTGQATSLDSALAGRTFTPLRYLSGASVVVAPLNTVRRVSYVGGAVRVDFLASDNATVLTSLQYSQYATVPLSGPMGSSPEELLAAVPVQDWIGFNNFSATANWQAGSAYIRHQGTRVGDVVILQDCPNDATQASTTGNQPAPCVSGQTLEQVFPVILPYQTRKPFENDLLADGTISQVAGVRMWVANSPLPLEQSITTAYRVYYEMNGNVYTGVLQRDGTPIRYRQADGSAVNYTVSLNQAAVNSLQAGVITGALAGSQAGSSAQVSPTVDLFGVGGHGINGALAPADLRTHYHFPTGLDGSGQTIAIVDAPSLHGDVLADLNVFSQVYGLPQCNAGNPCFQHVDLSSGNAPDDQWSGEIALDTQMAHAVAPGATIVLVTAASTLKSDMMAAVDYAAAIPGVTAISMSFGGGATALQAAANDALFASFQANGIVLLACTGDDGYSATASYPAASPYVTAVGGTTITSVDGAAGAHDESAWRYSGGGTNPYSPVPAWQSAVVGATAVNANGGLRTIPDVAAVADFQHSAFAIYREQQWVMAGGTSAATPLWAGISALLAQNLANKGLSLADLVRTTPGGFNGLLYQPRLLQGDAPALGGVWSGSNDLGNGDCSLCAAVGGFNDATGLGRPDVASFIAAF